MSAFSPEIAMGAAHIHKVVKNRNIPSYLHAECVKSPQAGDFFLINAPLRKKYGAGAQRLQVSLSDTLALPRGRDTDTRGVACLCSSCHGQQQSRRLLDETRGCALPPPVQVRPRHVRHQPGLAEEYGTHDEAAPSKLCTRILPNAWRTPLPSLARSQWT